MMHFMPSKVKNAILNDVACLKWLYCSTRLLATAKSSANKQVNGGEKGGMWWGRGGNVLHVKYYQFTANIAWLPNSTQKGERQGKSRCNLNRKWNSTPCEGHTWSNWPLELPFARIFFLAHCIRPTSLCLLSCLAVCVCAVHFSYNSSFQKRHSEKLYNMRLLK